MALALRLLLHLPLRQTEGFLSSVFELMGLHLDVSDHTSILRRAAKLQVPLRFRARRGPIDLVIDSSGLSVFGEGEWAASKHGGRGIQGWRKLHLGVDQDGSIVAQVLTEGSADDATTGVDLIDGVDAKVKAVVADSAYDMRPFCAAGSGRGARVVVPPIRNASAERDPLAARDRTVRRVAKVGRRQWKKESGYHPQGRVENAVSRFKSIIRHRLRARGVDGRVMRSR